MSLKCCINFESFLNFNYPVDFGKVTHFIRQGIFTTKKVQNRQQINKILVIYFQIHNMSEFIMQVNIFKLLLTN